MGELRVERFGRYELLMPVEFSGFARLYLARDTEAPGASTPVLLKRLSEVYSGDAAFIEKFLTSARRTAKSHHDNIARTLDFGVVGGEYFLAREWVDGRDLMGVRHSARRRGLKGMPEPIAVSVTRDVCQALHHAHTRMGMLHGSLSPRHVLLGFGGAVKVIDFSHDWRMLSPDTVSRLNIMTGKLQYFTPEWAAGLAEDARSEVYLTGVMLYQFLCGELHLRGDSDLARLDEVRQGRLIPARQHKPSLDEELLGILQRALMTSPEDRYPSAQALRDALSDWMSAHAPSFHADDRGQWLVRLRQESEGRGK
ncbi:serine/threonine protein kinase [Corallococcus silvisoli]|uniref:serine/threonine protein kinase n=1 Tax=Corallococcus silvisoli TaxID=2697031 RepID=UPI001377D2D9|nr:serine/threonine-protein kinase [Corallococcus silvisoli]NBD08212.1 protein kinase [Corallococcus silvisoli]